jgi:HEXXH motif-containing protein
MSEIDRILRKVIPFDISRGSHNSGSYSDVIGHIAMSYPIEIESPEIAVLEAILHEYNHNKINLVIQTEKLVVSDMREAYYSPYRPDARHIHGIYLGLHALAGAYWVIWQAHIAGILTLSDNWLEKSILYTLKNGLSLQVLDHHAKLTPLGREFLEEMRAVHMECLECIRRADIAPEMMARAKSALITHYQAARQKNPGILT